MVGKGTYPRISSFSSVVVRFTLAKITTTNIFLYLEAVHEYAEPPQREGAEYKYESDPIHLIL